MEVAAHQETVDAQVPRILKRAILKFQLNLSGLTILTEAATGPYLFTCILAALGGARRVFAVTRDSRFGPKEQVRDQTVECAQKFDVADRIQVIFDKSPDVVGQADIITNSGFVRPFDDTFIEWMKPTAVVPLMWETWELRKEEFDLKGCRRRGILVMGTNEHHPLLPLNRVMGFVAAKLMMDRGLSVYDDSVLLVASGPAGDDIGDFFIRNGVRFDRVVLKGSVPSSQKKRRITPLQAMNRLSQYDVLMVAEHVVNRCIIGTGGLFKPKRIQESHPDIEILHLCGAVNELEIARAGLRLFPRNAAPFGYMTVSGAYVGPKPVIELNTAGLKVGEAMARARIKGLSPALAARFALKHSPAKDF